MNTEYDFFLKNMKKELSYINYHLYEITKIYASLISGIDNFNKDISEEGDNKEEGKNFLKLKFIESMEHYNSKMDETINMKNYIENMIIENCEHTFIYDTIDSGLDNSMSIRYCTKCYKVKD